MNEYLKAFLRTIIPTTLIFIGRSEEFFTFLKKHQLFFDQNSSTDNTKLSCFILGLTWTGLVIPVQFEKLKKKSEKNKESFSVLLGQFKDTYIKSFKDKLNLTNSSLNTRIFVRKKGLIQKWKYLYNDEVHFELKDIKGISDKINVEKLSFKVAPNPEGLVGKSYTEKKSLMDVKVNPEKYNLTDYQKSKTSDIKFCCVAPIYDENNNIIAMISLDSRNYINFKEQELEIWDELINEYCIILDKFINN